MSANEDRVTVWAQSDLINRMDQHVNYGPPEYESRSQFVREAIRMRMVFQDALEHAGLELPDDQDERERMLRDIAFAGVDAYTDD